jgi:hypothetical protein
VKLNWWEEHATLMREVETICSIWNGNLRERNHLRIIQIDA